MKGKLLLTLAVAAVLVLSVAACSSLKKAAEETKKTTETPVTTTPGETTTTEGNITHTKVGNTHTYSGKLRGVNDSNKIDLFLNSSNVDVKFTWPSGAEYHAKVLGMTGNELGDFNLNEGDVVNLTGGGKFSLIVYSRGGDGGWTATYTDQ